MNKNTYESEPAFPQTKQVGDMTTTQGGMTLRDYFAAKAMEAIIHRCDSPGQTTNKTVARNAYWYADAMLAERGKGHD